MKRWKTWLSVVFLLGAAGYHQHKYSEIPVWKVPKLLAAMRAKEFCSCHLILKFEKDYCLSRVKKGYPIMGFALNEEKKTVRFNGLFSYSEATVQNPKLGCLLK